MDSERRLSIKYVAKQDVFGVRAAFDEGLVGTVVDACGWPERAMHRVGQEMDRRNRFWVALSDIHGLGQQGIGNLREKYESLEAVAEATEAELYGSTERLIEFAAAVPQRICIRASVDPYN
jgi:hypothetical protein